MVIDDEPLNIFVVQQMLISKNIECDTATNGGDALDMIQDRIENVLLGHGQMYKLILLDFSMPEMDGLTVAKEIIKMFRNNPLTSEE